ncbi:MAG: LytTR family DNA-binding domain-containing protein [Bacteroidota bacterium]
MIKELRERLQEPFPDRKNLKQSFLSLLGVGLFVSLFLYLIQPFGMRGVSGRDLLWICFGFGVVTVAFGLLYELLNRYAFRIQMDLPSWTLQKWIINSTGLILWIAFGNFLFINYVFGWNMLKPLFLVQMLGNTVMVGIFPIVFSGLMIQLRAARTYQHQAEQIHPASGLQDAALETTTSLVHLSPSPGNPIDIPTESLRYVEAMQNYVSVYYLEEDRLKKEVIRSTIANMESQLADSSMIRCHRSYLVNIDVIEKVNGNAQGLKLTLQAVSGTEIPVSRSYIPVLKKLLS